MAIKNEVNKNKTMENTTADKEKETNTISANKDKVNDVADKEKNDAAITDNDTEIVGEGGTVIDIVADVNPYQGDVLTIKNAKAGQSKSDEKEKSDGKKDTSITENHEKIFEKIKRATSPEAAAELLTPTICREFIDVTICIITGMIEDTKDFVVEIPTNAYKSYLIELKEMLSFLKVNGDFDPKIVVKFVTGYSSPFDISDASIEKDKILSLFSADKQESAGKKIDELTTALKKFQFYFDSPTTCNTSDNDRLKSFTDIMQENRIMARLNGSSGYIDLNGKHFNTDMGPVPKLDIVLTDDNLEKSIFSC